jgi:hypothetical protein
MRLRFWRRADPAWRDANDWYAHRHDGTFRELVVPVGDERLSIRLAIDASDVTLDVFGPSPGSARSLSWELVDVPTEAEALCRGITEVVRAGGCGEAEIERTVRMVNDEIVRLVRNARAEQDRRLSGLPPPADVRWGDIAIVDDGGSAERHGAYHDSSGTVDVRLSYALAMRIGGYNAGYSIVSARPGRARQPAAGLMPLDGICSEGVVQMLEIWGWPAGVALGVGRAAAVKARSDWIALQPQREAAEARQNEFWQQLAESAQSGREEAK